MAADGPRPIIVIKKKGGHAGHHGGAWKVAYADFVTAMMSLFIVLWLLNSTPQVKKAIAGYFNDPSGTSKETGSSSLGSGEAVSIDKLNVEKLKEEIQKAILKQANLEKLSKQVEITVTGEGLKIELLEGQGGTFFQSGSPKLNDNGENLLTLLAAQVKDLPNRLLIEGHTDSQPYSGDNGYTNWELSSDRANSARRLLQQGGVRSQQISQVRGYADQSLRKPGDPLDPSNRRISLIVQWQTAPPAAPGDQPAAGAEKAAGEEKSTSEKPSSPEVKPAAPTGPKSATPAPAPAESATAAAAAAQPPPPPAAAPKPGVMARVKALLPAKKK